MIDKACKILLLLSATLLFSTTTLRGNTKVLVQEIDLSNLSPIQSIDTLYSLGSIHFTKEKYDLSLEYFQKALGYSEAHKEQYQQLEILLFIGRAYFLTNNYSLSQQYLFELLDKSNEDTSSHLKSNALSLISSAYNSLGEVNLSYEYLLKSIKIKELAQDTLGIASGYYNLGSLFFYQNTYEKALDYYQKSNDIGVQLNNHRMIYNSVAAIGSVNESMGNIELALELHFRSLSIADSLDYLTGQAYSLGNIGSAYTELGEFVKAKSYIDKSLNLKKQLNDRWGQIGSHIVLSSLHVKTQEYKLAEKHIFSALEIAQILKAKSRIPDIYKQISELYEIINKSDLVIIYLNKYISTKDSLMNENILREMSNYKSKSALQKKEYEIDLLKKDNEILETQKKAQRFRLIGFGLLAVFFLIISIVFRSLLSRQKGFTRLLEAKNSEIEKQKSKIQIQNKELESSNEDLKQFAYVASHDLREPLRMITSYGKILTRRYKDTLDKNGQEFLFFMTDAASRMDNILLDLLDYAKTSSNSQSFEEVSTAEIMESIEKITESAFLEKNASLEIKKENLPLISGRKTQMYQLFQNFIINGLKYNLNENPHIKIDCITSAEEYVFSFTDNGIGIPEEHQAKIFEMFQRLHPNGEFEGTGIGLATCKKIADKHNGYITVQSKEGLGSTFYFHLPR